MPVGVTKSEAGWFSSHDIDMAIHAMMAIYDACVRMRRLIQSDTVSAQLVSPPPSWWHLSSMQSWTADVPVGQLFY